MLDYTDFADCNDGDASLYYSASIIVVVNLRSF